MPQKVRQLPVTLNELDVVRKGMYESVHHVHGGSKRANTDIISLYGKTGTAQVGSPGNRHYDTWFYGSEKHKDNLYAIAIVVEGGRTGGVTNAPMGKEFFTTWLKNN